MKSNFYSKNQRICSIVLTIALCLGMFAVSAVPAMAEGSVDPWELSGLHQDKVLNFEDLTVGDEFTGLSTIVASGEPVIAQDENDDNKYLNIPTGSTAYFDAHSDIETLSIDIRLKKDGKPTIYGSSVFQITYHRDKYTVGGTDYTPQARMSLQYDSTTNNWKFGTQGANTYSLNAGTFTTEDDWVTIKFVYGTEFASSDRTDRKDNLCGAASTFNNRHLTQILVTKLDGTVLSDYVPTSDTNGFWKYYCAAYGVNKNIKDDGIGAPTIQFGVTSAKYYAAFVDNVKVTYRNTEAISEVAAATKIFDDIQAEAGSISSDDFTEENVDKLEKAAGVCELLPSATAKYSEKIAELTKLYQNEKPEVLGATIKVEPNQENQMLRFNIKAPKLSDGAKITEYGAVMLPDQMLDGENLTLKTEKMLQASLGADVLPDEWNSYVYKIPADLEFEYCGVKITARPYVKYSVGDENYKYIAYGDSEVKSVNSVARTLFDLVVDTDKYSEEAFGEIEYTDGVTENLQPGTYPETLNYALEFLAENYDRIEAIVKSQPK